MEEWLSEKSLNDTVLQSFKVVKELYNNQSQFQSIRVVDTESLGKVLLLDDMAMISDKDEYIYHEVMVHTPMLAQPKTKKVLVLGAGDGGVIRELVRYSSIEEITLVEIDEMVTSVSKEFFPQVSCGLKDNRVSIKHEDALDFVEKSFIAKDKYDLIISDSTDPVGIAEGLYQSSFYEKIYSLLTDDGIFMCQTESPFYDEYDIKKIYQELRSTFNIVEPTCAPILIYPGVYWTFAFCSKNLNGRKFNNHKLKEYDHFAKDLRWHNPEWQKSSFVLPNFVRDKLGL